MTERKKRNDSRAGHDPVMVQKWNMDYHVETHPGHEMVPENTGHDPMLLGREMTLSPQSQARTQTRLHLGGAVEAEDAAEEDHLRTHHCQKNDVTRNQNQYDIEYIHQTHDPDQDNQQHHHEFPRKEKMKNLERQEAGSHYRQNALGRRLSSPWRGRPRAHFLFHRSHPHPVFTGMRTRKRKRKVTHNLVEMKRLSAGRAKLYHQEVMKNAVTVNDEERKEKEFWPMVYTGLRRIMIQISSFWKMMSTGTYRRTTTSLPP